MPPMRDLKSPFSGPLDSHEAADLAEVLHALANPSRLRIVSLLASGEASYVQQLVDPLDLTQGTVSHHVAGLVEAGLLTRGEYVDHCRQLRVERAAFRQVGKLLVPRGGR